MLMSPSRVPRERSSRLAEPVAAWSVGELRPQSLDGGRYTEKTPVDSGGDVL